MFNILLDKLPEDYLGFQIHSDFRTGIQISQAMDDVNLSQREKMEIAAELLFGDFEPLPSFQVASEGVAWFLSGWYTDKMKKRKSKEKPVMDFDRDQWRIYSAFLTQYNIDLNKTSMHYWSFMALLSTLNECSLTHVMDIRSRKLDQKASKEAKQALLEAKDRYGLESEEERETERERVQREMVVADFLSKLPVRR